MTPTEAAFTFRFVAMLCAFMLLGGLIGLSVVTEIARRREPHGHAVSTYTVVITAVTVAAIAYLLAGDTP